MARAISTPRGTRCLAFTLYGHLKRPLLESYEICPIPEVVLAAPEDLVDSAERLARCQWLAKGHRRKKTVSSL
ncbi:hydrogenase expression/formation C-terminal domain-containing protein [Shigella sonnei]